MKIIVKTNKKEEIIDITSKINDLIKIDSGICNIFVKHTTAGIRINEKEERLLKDIKSFLEKIVPNSLKCLHDDIELRDCPSDEPKNGPAHLKSLILNSSETIPIVDGKLDFGTWQSLLFFELDGPREREVVINFS